MDSFIQKYPFPSLLPELLVITSEPINVGLDKFLLAFDDGSILEVKSEDNEIIEASKEHKYSPDEKYRNYVRPKLAEKLKEKYDFELGDRVLETVISTSENLYHLYPAKRKNTDQPIILFTLSEIELKPKNPYRRLLRPLTGEEHTLVLEKPPLPSGKDKIHRHLGFEENVSLTDVLANYVLTPERELTKSQIRAILSWDWDHFVEDLITMGAVSKDPKMAVLFEGYILPNFDQRTAPHTMCFTMPQTGRSTFYDLCGLNFSKITAVTLIGTVDNHGVINYGVAHKFDRTINIEQIEESDYPQILRWMLSYLDSGRALGGARGVSFLTEGEAYITLTGNIIGGEDKVTFSQLLGYLALNTVALGRRILPIYSRDIKPVTWTEINEEENFYIWDLAKQIGSFLKPTLKEYFKESRIWSWVHSKIPEFTDTCLNALENAKDSFDEKASLFWQETAKHGVFRIRRWALNRALLYKVPLFLEWKIGGEKPDTNEIIELAEDFLPDCLDIILHSLNQLLKDPLLTGKADWTIYKQLSADIQALVRVSAKHYEMSKPEIGVRVPIESLESAYIELEKDGTKLVGWASYWSQIIQNILKRKNFRRLNQRLQRFEIRLDQDKDQAFLIYLKEPRIIPDKPVLDPLEKRQLIYRKLRQYRSPEDGLTNKFTVADDEEVKRLMHRSEVFAIIDKICEEGKALREGLENVRLT